MLQRLVSRQTIRRAAHEQALQHQAKIQSQHHHTAMGLLLPKKHTENDLM
jgi:hypothetical protein